MSHVVDSGVNFYLEERAQIEDNIIQYLDQKDENENEVNVFTFFDKLKSQETGLNAKTILHLVRSIIENHHRQNDFFTKIEKIIIYFKRDIEQIFTNEQLFDFFHKIKFVF